MKRFDIVIFGATSFVGKLVTQHMLDIHGVGQSVSWAIAGRSQVKLEKLRESYGSIAQPLPIILADAHNLEQLKVLCKQTRVIISTAGPYALFGDKLIQACAETGTDYCDITGETLWVSEMILRHEKMANQTGARLVNFCGFDSIPSDMGVHFLQNESLTRYGAPCTNVQMRIYHARGNPPGGTYATAMDFISKAVKSKSFRAALANPYLLCPPDHGVEEKQNEAYLPMFDKKFKQWTAAFVMAIVNTRVVHRSNAISGHRYGKKFKYEEAILVGPNVFGFIGAYVVTGVMATFVILAALPVTSYFVKRFIPKPGEGSNLKSLINCGFDIRFTGATDRGEKVFVRLTAKGDPACYATSRMLAESGICLAKEISKTEKPGGFWTTSSIFSDKLIDRIHQHGQMKFEVVDE